MQKLYLDIWKCPKLHDCKFEFPHGCFKGGQYWEIPYVGNYWSNDIDD
ncbi:MAG: hypothetical protein ACTSR3_21420 [Candidatus Helarchaeota archaeon]